MRGWRRANFHRRSATRSTRATRPLTGELPTPPALTPEQLQRIADLRAFAAKKQKVAKLLIAAALAEEAEPHHQAAEKALAEASAIMRGVNGIPDLK